MFSMTQEIIVKGKNQQVQSFHLDNVVIVTNGGFIRVAEIFDEYWLEADTLPDPHRVLQELRDGQHNADLFTFSQRVPDIKSRFDFHMEWDNVAVAHTASFIDWWDHKIPQETRKNVRRAAKRGVSVQLVTFDDEFVRGVKGIYDEMPIRQGRRFWHFSKDFETIKAENGTYLDRSEFIGAYHSGELIGFIKFVYVGQIAQMMQILSKASHYDKRPMNALIAKAVEVCHEKGISYLVYGKFTYGNKMQSQLADFKRRNGFVQMDFPKYFIPLTLKGKMALALKLHRGLLGLLPPGLIDLLWRVRSALAKFANKT